MTSGRAASPVWDDALLAATLFAIDPAGLAGVVARGGPTPARDRWIEVLRRLLGEASPMRRAPLHIEDERLLGGLDLTASLAAGRPVAQRGLLAECDGGVVMLPMAERLEIAAAGRYAAVLDRGEVVVERDGLALRHPARVGLVALDEGLDDEERPPAALLERLALRIDLSGLGHRQAIGDGPAAADVLEARARLAHIAPPSDPIVEALCETAALMGIDSARAPLLALRAARAHAALRGHTVIDEGDAAVAARLVLAPRALRVPAPPEAGEPSPPDSTDPPEPQAEADDAEPPAITQDEITPVELVLEAIQAALPDDLFDRLRLEGAPGARARGSRGAGAAAKSARRGRPQGSRQGPFRAGDRLNLVETLRAATPWQGLRGGERTGRVQVRAEDFRIRRFVRRAESTTIFSVDASGSSAVQRLAEAKGAVELLLAKAYVTRTRVAVIAFRGSDAEVLLPPTRSLTRAKRCLAALPGGGGTPLAAGIDLALTLALSERSAERTPTLVFLTDGRANIARDGAPGRSGAEADALVAAQRVGAAAIAAVWLDTAARPRPDGDRFARAMGAAYAPLPYANAETVSAMVDALGPGRK
jgi:magnesium chelatase subunit D